MERKYKELIALVLMFIIVLTMGVYFIYNVEHVKTFDSPCSYCVQEYEALCMMPIYDATGHKVGYYDIDETPKEYKPEN